MRLSPMRGRLHRRRLQRRPAAARITESAATSRLIGSLVRCRLSIGDQQNYPSPPLASPKGPSRLLAAATDACRVPTPSW
jgi:hypothetical protein